MATNLITTSKQRAYLKSLAVKEDAILNIGKESLTEEFVSACDEALEARELIKVSVLKNCDDDIKAIAEAIAEHTDSQVVQVIGRKIVLFRPARDPKKRNIKI